MSYDFDHQPRGMSSGTKVVIGCGAVAFLTIALICGGFVLVGFRFADNMKQIAEEFVEELQQHVEEFATRFEAQGYHRVTGQVVDISSDITQPTVYTVQVFTLNADAEASIAVMAQVAEINGRIDGDLHFYGQMLTIGPDAVITGNVHVEMAQTFENNGTVEGEVIRTESEFEFGEEHLGDEADALPDSELKPSPGDVIEQSSDVEGETATDTTGENAADSETLSPQENGDTAEEDSSHTEPSETEPESQSSN